MSSSNQSSGILERIKMFEKQSNKKGPVNTNKSQPAKKENDTKDKDIDKEKDLDKDKDNEQEKNNETTNTDSTSNQSAANTDKENTQNVIKSNTVRDRLNALNNKIQSSNQKENLVNQQNDEKKDKLKFQKSDEIKKKVQMMNKKFNNNQNIQGNEQINNGNGIPIKGSLDKKEEEVIESKNLTLNEIVANKDVGVVKKKKPKKKGFNFDAGNNKNDKANVIENKNKPENINNNNNMENVNANNLVNNNNNIQENESKNTPSSNKMNFLNTINNNLNKKNENTKIPNQNATVNKDSKFQNRMQMFEKNKKPPEVPKTKEVKVSSNNNVANLIKGLENRKKNLTNEPPSNTDQKETSINNKPSGIPKSSNNVSNNQIFKKLNMADFASRLTSNLEKDKTNQRNPPNNLPSNLPQKSSIPKEKNSSNLVSQSIYTANNYIDFVNNKDLKIRDILKEKYKNTIIDSNYQIHTITPKDALKIQEDNLKKESDKQASIQLAQNPPPRRASVPKAKAPIVRQEMSREEFVEKYSSKNLIDYFGYEKILLDYNIIDFTLTSEIIKILNVKNKPEDYELIINMIKTEIKSHSEKVLNSENYYDLSILQNYIIFLMILSLNLCKENGEFLKQFFSLFFQDLIDLISQLDTNKQNVLFEIINNFFLDEYKSIYFKDDEDRDETLEDIFISGQTLLSNIYTNFISHYEKNTYRKMYDLLLNFDLSYDNFFTNRHNISLNDRPAYKLCIAQSVIRVAFSKIKNIYYNPENESDNKKLKFFEFEFLKTVVIKDMILTKERFGDDVKTLFRKEDLCDDIIKYMFFIFGNNMMVESFVLPLKRIYDYENLSDEEMKTRVINTVEYDHIFHELIANLSKSIPYVLKVILKLVYVNTVNTFTMGSNLYGSLYTLLIFNFLISPRVQAIYNINPCKSNFIRGLNRLIRNTCYNTKFNDDDPLSEFNEFIQENNKLLIDFITNSIMSIDENDDNVKQMICDTFNDQYFTYPQFLFYDDSRLICSSITGGEFNMIEFTEFKSGEKDQDEFYDGYDYFDEQ